MEITCKLSHIILEILGVDATYKEEAPKEQLFYSITQVSEIVGVQPHVIRYWEKHFSVLKPGRGSSSNWRNYVAADIEYLKEIKSLVNDKGLTISGAKKMLGKGSQEQNIINKLESILAELETA